MKESEMTMHMMGLAPVLAQSKCSISSSHGNICPRFLLPGDLQQALKQQQFERQALGSEGGIGSGKT